MKLQSSTKRMLGTSSVLALSAAAFLASSGTPASAQATQGIYLGGSSLASEAFRQIFDCYTGATVGGDGYTFDATFPGAGKLPTTCTVPAKQAPSVQGMYAAVGSGNGVRGIIANNPQQWYSGNAAVGSGAPPFPAASPPYKDVLNGPFNRYPYPRVDIGMSDSPLAVPVTALVTASASITPAIDWQNTLTVTTLSIANTTYSTTVYGAPIQIPAFEVNVAIPVNVNAPSFTINSQIKSSGNIVTGGAIQLTTGQLCAIFSGLVTNWADGGAGFPSTAIPYRDNSSPNVIRTANFNYANVGNGVGVAQPYSNAAAPTGLPIKVVYRADGSGTSFILTNYLKAVCPLLDPDNTYGYQSIYNASNLPSTSFSNLITNIAAFRGAGPWNSWSGVQLSSGVQAAVNDQAGTSAGSISYLSADFVKPYAIVATAPHAASLQNEDLRINGVNIPNTVSTSALTFIPPTPAGADAAWKDTRLQTPALTWTYADYNIYNNTFTTPVVQGGVTLSGQSVLPLTNVVAAYPLSGTAFMDLYSCYNTQSDSNRATNIRDFLTWYINGAANARLIVENNGFHLLPPAYTNNIVTQYLTASQPGYIQNAKFNNANNGGCIGVVGGIASGAK